MVQVVNADNYQEFIRQGILSDSLRADPVKTPEGPSPYRFCSLDTHSDECGTGKSGCQRTDAILEWEAENLGQYVSPFMYWHPRSLFFEHGDYIYYHKKTIHKNIDDDYQNRQDPEFQKKMGEHRDLAMDAFEFTDDGQWSECLFGKYDLRAVIEAQPTGMPKFVKETDGFYVFESVGTKTVSPEILNPLMLRNIQHMCNDSPYFFCTMDIIDSLYIKDGQFYFTDLSMWVSSTLNPAVRRAFTLGLSLQSGNKLNFYPFARSYLNSPNILHLINFYLQNDLDGLEIEII